MESNEENLPRAQRSLKDEDRFLSAADKHGLPWAVPDIQLATNESERNQLSAALEPFQNFVVECKRVKGTGDDKIRDFFFSATIPGLRELIPILGLQEKRRSVSGKLALMTVENYIFTGEEKKKAGLSLFYIPFDKGCSGLDFYSNEYRRILSCSLIENVPTVFDEFGVVKFEYRVDKKRRNSVMYSAVEKQINRVIATIELIYNKQVFGEKSFNSMEVKFTDLIDNEFKYPVLISLLLLVYMNKMY